MQLKLEIWRDGVLIFECPFEQSKLVDPVVDYALTQIQNAIFGIGRFKVDAFEVADCGAVQRYVKLVPEFHFPARVRASSPPS
ncbi:hypothetical protein [Acidiphilium angustum]|uniref:hypothetical protein n=1 Tax=Acidiphilium angustum TaxID=523 RepID=UPI000494730F|nr:hypothetical protein [Acidiphilium angustum]